MTIFRLARTIRWASVVSLTRNARAICGCGEADHGAQGQGEPGLRRQRRVAAREQQRQPVVGAGPLAAVPGPGRRPGREAALPAGPAYGVEGVAVGGDLQPGGGVVAADRPGARRSAPRRPPLDRLLGEVEVAEAAGQPGHQQTGLLAQGAREEQVAGGVVTRCVSPSMCE